MWMQTLYKASGLRNKINGIGDLDGDSLKLNSEAKSVGVIWVLVASWRSGFNPLDELRELLQCLKHGGGTSKIVVIIVL